MATKKDSAIAAANVLMNLCKQIQGLRASLNDFVTQYNTQGFSTTWGAMATSPAASDGSLSTADASPNAANPIDTRVSGQGSLTKTVSKNQLVSAVVALQQLQNFLTNQTVAQGNYNQSIDDLAS